MGSKEDILGGILAYQLGREISKSELADAYAFIQETEADVISPDVLEAIAERLRSRKGKGEADSTVTVTLETPPLNPDEQADWLNETLDGLDERLAAIVKRQLANPNATIEKVKISFAIKVDPQKRRVDLTAKATYNLYQH